MGKKKRRVRFDFKELTRIAVITWLGSICLFIFFLLPFLTTGNQLKGNTLQEKIMQFDVIVGFVAFFAAIAFALIDWVSKLKIVKKIKKHKDIKQLALALILIFLLPVTAFTGSAIKKVREENKPKQQNQFTPIPSPTPTPTPLSSPLSKPNIQNTQRIIDDGEPWGVAKQIDEVTWTMKVGQDERMGTPQEIYEALNNYRQRNRSSRLDWDGRLAAYAQSRADYFNEIGDIDKHAGFNEYINNPDNLKTLGFWWVGENTSHGYKLLGVHIIEWIYAGDEPHDKNQLEDTWSHVGIGVSGTATALIFGKYKI